MRWSSSQSNNNPTIMRQQRRGHQLQQHFSATFPKTDRVSKTLLRLNFTNRETVPATLITLASRRSSIAPRLLPKHDHQPLLVYHHHHRHRRFVPPVAGPATSRSEAAPTSTPAMEALPSRSPSPSLELSLRVLCPDDDPEIVAQCCDTIGQGFASEPNNAVFSIDPSQYAARWRAIAHNTLLRSRGVPLVHCLSLSSNLGAEAVQEEQGGQGEGEDGQGGQGQERVAAVALAYSYPDQKVPDEAPEPPGIIDLSRISRPEAIPIRDDLLSFISAKKTEFLKTHGSFEYVAFLATRPEYWGRGLGSRLLRYVTDEADAAGRWCYLEATNPDNVRLYERHGFQELETKVWTLESLPGQRVMLILMARPPVSGA
ncbi:hypothetical protein Vretimale_9709 [Volvox reticuliferus]|uniref:N-acetyltransferase domain-containing protein n=1 Tax=Volvox reticuliferus TaxID=1737510 RepID=A0A8J4FUL5_9CHLO|nr:hypothetical protein Vretifemale_13509 [Volvox reticuliferus]GIM05322.1 hypothetical protein Vretimale_9709 [Volvox reticuliferus]